MSKKFFLLLSPVMIATLMATAALAQPPVRQVNPQGTPQQPSQQQPPQQTQPAQQQTQQLQMVPPGQQGQQVQQAPRTRDVGSRNAGQAMQRIQRTVPTQMMQQQGGGVTGPLRMQQNQQFQMIQPGPTWYLGIFEEPAPQGVRVNSVNWNTPASGWVGQLDGLEQANRPTARLLGAADSPLSVFLVWIGCERQH